MTAPDPATIHGQATHALLFTPVRPADSADVTAERGRGSARDAKVILQQTGPKPTAGQETPAEKHQGQQSEAAPRAPDACSESWNPDHRLKRTIHPSPADPPPTSRSRLSSLALPGRSRVRVVDACKEAEVAYVDPRETGRHRDEPQQDNRTLVPEADIVGLVGLVAFAVVPPAVTSPPINADDKPVLSIGEQCKAYSSPPRSVDWIGSGAWPSQRA
ncbi:hypothetical protein PG988_011770 [Apiospora saccharicola]